jgi:hypothetical protein
MASNRLGWSDPRFTGRVSVGEAGLGCCYQNSALHPLPRAPRKRRPMSCNPFAGVSICRSSMGICLHIGGWPMPPKWGSSRSIESTLGRLRIKTRRDQASSQFPWALDGLYSGELQGRGRLLAIGEPEVSRWFVKDDRRPAKGASACELSDSGSTCITAVWPIEHFQARVGAGCAVQRAVAAAKPSQHALHIRMPEWNVDRPKYPFHYQFYTKGPPAEPRTCSNLHRDPKRRHGSF